VYGLMERGVFRMVNETWYNVCGVTVHGMMVYGLMERRK